MAGKTERLMAVIRKTPLFRQLVPQEAGIGWPMPVRQGDKVFVKLPIFGFSRTVEKGKTALFPPFAMISVDWSNGLPVEYTNFHFHPPSSSLKWEGQVGTFPHSTVARMKRSQYEEQRRELLSMYDDLFDTLARGESLPESWENQFTQLLETLVEPPFIPYYRAMAPKFFNRFLRTVGSAIDPVSEGTSAESQLTEK